MSARGRTLMVVPNVISVKMDMDLILIAYSVSSAMEAISGIACLTKT
jgi:hypothetical protein